MMIYDITVQRAAMSTGQYMHVYMVYCICCITVQRAITSSECIYMCCMRYSCVYANVGCYAILCVYRCGYSCGRMHVGVRCMNMYMHMARHPRCCVISCTQSQCVMQ